MNSTENILKRAGYQIVGKKQKEPIIIRVNGKDHFGLLEAALTVQKEKQPFVVFVKESEKGLDPNDPDLRCKLIEYDRLFGLSGVLLVNPQREEIQEVSFKFPCERNLDFYFQFFTALFIVALVVGIIWLLVHLKLF